MAQTSTLHIVIVDDDDHLRLLARMLVDDALSEVEHRITEVADGETAIELCRREQVDILVLDLHMPNVSGHAVLDSLSDLPDSPRVVAWSADAHALQVAAHQGAHATAIKGTDGKNLIVAVRGCLPRLRTASDTTADSASRRR